MFFLLLSFVIQPFPLDSQDPGNTVGRVEDAPHTKAVSVVEATTSQILSGSALPQEKLKLAHKLLTVSSRIIRALVILLDQVMYTNPLSSLFGRRC